MLSPVANWINFSDRLIGASPPLSMVYPAHVLSASTNHPKLDVFFYCLKMVSIACAKMEAITSHLLSSKVECFVPSKILCLSLPTWMNCVIQNWKLLHYVRVFQTWMICVIQNWKLLHYDRVFQTWMICVIQNWKLLHYTRVFQTWMFCVIQNWIASKINLMLCIIQNHHILDVLSPLKTSTRKYYKSDSSLLSS